MPCGECTYQTKTGAKKSEHMFGYAFDWDTGNNDPQGSLDLYVIYEYIRDSWKAEWENDSTKTRPVIILYDDSGTEYYAFAADKPDGEVIPKDYDANTSEIQFTHGHTVGVMVQIGKKQIRR